MLRGGLLTREACEWVAGIEYALSEKQGKKKTSVSCCSSQANPDGWAERQANHSGGAVEMSLTMLPSIGSASSRPYSAADQFKGVPFLSHL